MSVRVSGERRGSAHLSKLGLVSCTSLVTFNSLYSSRYASIDTLQLCDSPSNPTRVSNPNLRVEPSIATLQKDVFPVLFPSTLLFRSRSIPTNSLSLFLPTSLSFPFFFDTLHFIQINKEEIKTLLLNNHCILHYHTHIHIINIIIIISICKRDNSSTWETSERKAERFKLDRIE